MTHIYKAEKKKEQRNGNLWGRGLVWYHAEPSTQLLLGYTKQMAHIKHTEVLERESSFNSAERSQKKKKK